MKFQQTTGDMWHGALVVLTIFGALLFALYPLKNTLGLIPFLDDFIPTTLRDVSPLMFLQANQVFVFYLLGVVGFFLVFQLVRSEVRSL